MAAVGGYESIYSYYVVSAAGMTMVQVWAGVGTPI